MAKLKDYAGLKFGRLSVIEFSERKNRNTFWKCLCDCGNYRCVNIEKLKQGRVKSCGCLKNDLQKMRQNKFRQTVFHGRTSAYSDDVDDFWNDAYR